MAIDFNSLLGSSGSSGGMDSNILQQWQMLRANGAAYRRLLEAEKTGTVKNGNQPIELMSDKYFNDNYDSTTKELVRPTYKPDASVTPSVDASATAGDNMESMRRIALAAVSSPDSLNSVHYSLFEQLRNTIAANLVKTPAAAAGGSGGVVTGEASAAGLSRDIGSFRLLTDAQSFTIAGKNGEVTYSFGVGDSWEDVVAAINGDSGKTGVSAELVKDGDGNLSQIKLASTEKGKDNFIRVDQITGNLFANPKSSTSARGTDAGTSGGSTVADGDQAMAAIAAGVKGGTLEKDQVFTIAGTYGAKQYSFAAGAAVEDIVAAINADSNTTGVGAQLIQNANGGVAGIGLLSAKGGSGQYVQVAQKTGDLFAREGDTVKALGKNTGVNEDGSSINSIYDLGRVDIGGTSYSFADLGPGGAASLDKSPDVVLAIIDKAMQDIYSGKAKVKGFDVSDSANAVYIPKASDNKNVVDSGSTSNVMTAGGLNLDDLKAWLASYAK